MHTFHARILKGSVWKDLPNPCGKRREDAVFELGLACGVMHATNQEYRTGAVFRRHTKTGEEAPCFFIDPDEYEAWEAERETA